MTEPSARPKRRWYNEQEAGIGGWLLLFAIGQVLGALSTAWQVPKLWHAFVIAGASLATQSYPAYPYIVLEEVVGMALRTVLYLVGLALILRRDPRTPTYYKIVLPLVALLAATDLLLAARFHAVYHSYRLASNLPTTATDAAHDRAQLATLRLILYAIVWFWYWRVSERVRLTFTPGASSLK